MKFKAIIEVVYNVHPNHYGDDRSVEEMLQIDQENFESDPHALINMWTEENPLEISVVKHESSQLQSINTGGKS